MEDWMGIVNDYGPAAWKTAYRLLGNEADASDCLQDAFAAAVKMSRRQVIRSWPALLRRLVMTRALDKLRHRMRRKGRHSDVDPPEIADKSPGPPELVQAGELAEWLKKALTRLPAPQAAAFCMRYLDQLSYEQIAEAMDETAANVGVLLHRARAMLRGMLDVSRKAAKAEVNHD